MFEITNQNSSDFYRDCMGKFLVLRYEWPSVNSEIKTTAFIFEKIAHAKSFKTLNSGNWANRIFKPYLSESGNYGLTFAD